MLHRFVSNINDKVTERLKKFEQLSSELVKSFETYPMEIFDITPEGFKTPTKKQTSSPVVSPSKTVKCAPLTPMRTNSSTSSSSRRIPGSDGRKRRRRFRRLCPTRAELKKIMKEMEVEEY
nr:expressed protein [Hymenolepis microstoma]